MCEELEDKILNLARNGLCDELNDLIKENLGINISCQGKSKSNKSWTPLHLAAYFGHKEMVEMLLSNGADPNVLNHTGDTALHKAALTSREDVVLALLKYDATTFLKNDEGKKASQVTHDERICNLLEAAEKVEALKLKENFLQAVKEGRVEATKDMLLRNLVAVNVSDDLGNTALHHAAMRDQRAMTVVLLQCGADPSKVNKAGAKALDVCESQQMKKLLEVRPLRSAVHCAKRFEGPLLKRKRFLGPRWHWVVLERGVMSFFMRRADAAIGSKRKIYKYLTEATVSIREDSPSAFNVRFFDGSHHNLMVNKSNNPLVHRQKWVDAIKEHADFSNHFVVADRVIESDNEDDDVVTVLDIKNLVQTAQVHHQMLKGHIDELTTIVQQFVANENSTKIECQRLSTLVLGKSHKVLTTSSELSDAFGSCISMLDHQDQAREGQLRDEREKNRVLEQALQALATEHHNLEQTISSQGGPGSPAKPAMPNELDMNGSARHASDSSAAMMSPSSGGFLSDEDEFYDAVSGESEEDTDEISLPGADYDAVNEAEPNGHVPASSTSEQLSRLSELPLDQTETKAGHGTRTSLPVPMFSRDEFSIWHILRQCIGKELSKITMPVIFNEPLSFIQRLCEYMEYSCLLEKACSAQDSIARMEYVAAFAVSSLASQMHRLGKPFNPLLGETYEYRRDDLGFHWVSEQVSHHPPVSAFHAEGTDPSTPFTFHGSVYPKLKFWGKSIEIEPRGLMVLKLTNFGETYTWSNPKISIHNIVVGKLWMEQHGVTEIVNHKTSERCVVTFKTYSWFRNDINRIEGVIHNERKEEVRILVGDWTKYVYSMHPDVHKDFVTMTTVNADATSGKSSKRKSRNKSQSSVASDDVVDSLTSLCEEKDCRLLWSVQSRPANSSQMYNMTQFAMSLNEEEVKGYDLPPTDSRLRPDIRELENGDIDGASAKKHILEEKQRASRKVRHKQKEEWAPRWFMKKSNTLTKSEEWVSTEKYNARDWSNCPDIF